MRLALMQVWPALRYLDATAPSTAASRSASSNTMKGALPPSSRDRRLIWPEASRISQAPTAVEPVKVILAIFGLWQNSSPIGLASPVTTEKQPLGTPARSARIASASADSGVCGAGFNTMVQPAASAEIGRASCRERV